MQRWLNLSISSDKIEYLGFLIESVEMKISLEQTKKDRTKNLNFGISTLRIIDFYKLLSSFAVPELPLTRTFTYFIWKKFKNDFLKGAFVWSYNFCWRI